MTSNSSNSEKRAANLGSANESEGSSSVTGVLRKSPSSSIHDKINVYKTRSKTRNKAALVISKGAPKEKKNVASSTSKCAPKDGCSPSKRKANRYDVAHAEWINEIQCCPTFRPSEEEFKDPIAYLQKIAPTASKYGMCKIVSPLSPTVPPASVLENTKFRAEYVYLNTKYRNRPLLTARVYDIKEFEEMANQDCKSKYDVPAQCCSSQLENDFWKQICPQNRKSVKYVNLNASAFSSDKDDPLGTSDWNLQNFARLPESPLRFLKKDIMGVTTPKLFIGMLYSFDYWHAEHGHLYRIDYHHCGAPKTWYGVPSHAASEFERVLEEFVFPEIGFQKYKAHDVLNHKAMLFSPRSMVKHKCPIYKTVQSPGEFVITFPKAYHTAFSHGFSCSEAVNFATREWFPFGAEASERRAFYGWDPIIPYQQLLCKEAKNLFHHKKSEIDSPSFRNLKVYFACLIRLHHSACEEIRKTGACVAIAPHSKKFEFCNLCKRECYLAYITCNCFPEPICIFHDIIYLGCSCKGKRVRVMWVKEKILNMQKIATKFEEEGTEFVKEVKNLLMECATLGCIPSMNLQWGLEELISVEAMCRKVSGNVPRMTMKYLLVP